jgi:uncharacterized protein YkwD
MASPGHRANVLQGAFTHGGVGAYAADNINFLGKVRSPRMYTELFMQAASSTAPPPPPSGGGGGGGGGGSGGSTGGSSRPAAPPTPAPKAFTVDAPTAPTSSQPLDGLTAVAAVSDATPPAAVRAMTWDDPQPSTDDAAPVQTASQLRIQASAATEQGLFETVLGSLIGFFF